MEWTLVGIWVLLSVLVGGLFLWSVFSASSELEPEVRVDYY